MSSVPPSSVRASRRRASAVVVGLLTAAGLGVTSSPARADDGWIFSRCFPQLCRVDGDGHHKVTLTTDGLGLAGFGRPFGSRDGQVLAYASQVSPIGSPMSSWVVRPETGAPPQRIDPQATIVDLLPDGSRALLTPSVWYDGVPRSVCSVSTVDGGDRRCYTPSPGAPYATDYAAPDLLLGVSSPVPTALPGSYDRSDSIVEMTSAGTPTRTVATLAGYGLVDPELSPDGRSVVVTAMSRLGQLGRIAIFDRASGALVRWLSPASEPGRATDDAPAWSPDGRRIVFHRQDPGYDDELYVIDADGAVGSERRVGPGTDPAWTQEPVPPSVPMTATFTKTRVVVRAPAPGKVRVAVDRSVRRGSRQAWRRQSTRSVRAVRTGDVRVPIRRLRPGRYRLTVTARRDDRARTPVLRLVRRLR